MKHQSLIDQSELNGKIKVLADIQNQGTCLSVRLSHDGKYYAVALANGKVHLFNSKNDKLIYKINDNLQNERYAATAVRFRPWGLQNITPNNILIAAFTDGNIKTYHFPSLTCVHEMNEGRETLTAEYSRHGDTFGTSGNDGVVRIYDDETRKLLISYAPEFYENAGFRRIYSIAFNPTNTDEFITGGWDNVIRHYDLRIPNLIKKTYGPNICGEGLDFSPSGKEFCSASWRAHDSLQIWDYGSSKLIKTFNSENSNVKKKMVPSKLNYACKYFSDTRILVGGTSDDAVAVVDINSEKVCASITRLQHSVYSLDCHKSNFVFVSGEYVGLVHLFE